MEKIAFFGKGGIGKSTIASNVTAALALEGRRVLHVGCDPKMDSALLLMGRRISSFAAACQDGEPGAVRASIHASPMPGVYCIEAGGPEPGLGCAGAGIGQMFDMFNSVSLLEGGSYDAVVYDVLGDVVCGGFAAPLRLNFAAKTVIVTSETAYSLYAANRLIGMVANFHRNGARLAGLVANVRSPEGEAVVRRFAGATGARLLGTLLPDPAVAKAERRRCPAVKAFPGSAFSRRIRLLLPAIVSRCPEPAARALPEEEFFAFVEGGTPRRQEPAPAAAPVGRSAVRVLRDAGFALLGLENAQVLCDWASPAGPRRVLIAPSSSPHSGAARVSDLVLFFHPSCGKTGEAEARALVGAAAGLSGISFRDIAGVFFDRTGFYGGITPLCGLPDTDLRHKSSVGFGEAPFILRPPSRRLLAPPGAVVAELSDNECRFAVCERGRLGLTHEEDEHYPENRPSLGPLPPLPDSRMHIAEINMRDAVMGSEEKAFAVLRRAAERAGPGGLVVFYTGCSHLTLGFDPAEAMRKVEKEKGARIVFIEEAEGREKLRADEVFTGFMTGKLKERPTARKAGVNLIGFGACGETLARLLAGYGIPAAEPGAFYEKAASAALNVLSGASLWMGPAFEAVGLRWLHAPPPYGFGATRKWLSGIAGALGMKRFAAGPSAAQLSAAAELRRRARRYSAGLGVWSGEEELLEGRRIKAALSLLLEGGFGTGLFVFSPGKKPSRPEREDVAREFSRLAGSAGKASGGRGPAVRFLDSPGDLRAPSAGGRGLRIFYSDLRNDTRVTSAGLTPFSADIFLPGYEGALETWKRLLELCEWDFNEKHSAR